MIFKIKKPLILLSIVLIANTSMFCMSSQKEEIKNPPSKTEIQDVFQQKIDCAEMTMLNKLLLLKPNYALRLKSTYNRAKEIINYFESKVQKDLEKQTTTADGEKTKKAPTPTTTALTTDEELSKVLDFRDKILNPVNTFFAQLYDHQPLLGGLVGEIFTKTNFVKTKEELNNTLMLTFFQVDKQKAKTFFHDILITKELLLKACKEFEVLFGVVNASLSTEVKAKADEAEKNALATLKKQLTNQKNQDQQNNKSKLNNQKQPE